MATATPKFGGFKRARGQTKNGNWRSTAIGILSRWEEPPGGFFRHRATAHFLMPKLAMYDHNHNHVLEVTMHLPQACFSHAKLLTLHFPIKLTAKAPENRGRAPKENDRIPTIHFVRCYYISFREGKCYGRRLISKVCQSDPGPTMRPLKDAADGAMTLWCWLMRSRNDS